MSGPGDLIDAFGEIFDQLVGTGGAIYVSPPPPGWDGVTAPGSGSLDDPYHSISTALGDADGGRNVYLREGRYIESVVAVNVSGTENDKIIVKPYRHERVTIDCLIEDFLHPTSTAYWERFVAGGPDEYVWTQTFTGIKEQIRRGAFLDTHQHTKLVAYDQVGDLRADNELDLRDLPAGDNHVWVAQTNAAGVAELVPTNPKRFRSWMYMGPGLWFDPSDGTVHIRLSHTHNHVLGWPDYTGPTNPNEVRLALSREETHALFLRGCHHIQFKDLDFRFGDEDTIRLRNCSNIEFDHVNIRAASRAIRLEVNDKPFPDGTEEQNADIVFQHCEIDGGTPTWFFRSDRKDAYNFTPVADAGATLPQRNQLGFSTTGVLISSRRNASNIHIHHCKIFNGHDVCVFGEQMRFHHNWVHNINDDALFMGSDPSGADDDAPATEPPETNNAWVYRNVITQSLTALSFGTKKPVGQIRIFRNLFDLRSPTLGIRPRHAFDNPLRHGQFYKSNGPEGPFDLWHNTCLTLNAGATYLAGEPDELNDAGFNHYASVQDHDGVPAGRRRAFNNIFVAAYPFEGLARPVAFLPTNVLGPTDGNTYCRVGPSPAPPDPTAPTDPTSPPAQGVQAFVVRGDPRAYFTVAAYETDHGWEEQGRLADPGFVSHDNWAGYPYPDDDLRLQGGIDGSAAIDMEDDMNHVEREAGGLLALFFGRERGCYWASWDRLHVSVDGNDVFPI